MSKIVLPSAEDGYKITITNASSATCKHINAVVTKADGPTLILTCTECQALIHIEYISNG